MTHSKYQDWTEPNQSAKQDEDVKVFSRMSLSEARFVCCLFVSKEKIKIYNYSGSITVQCCNVLPQTAMSNKKIR